MSTHSIAETRNNLSDPIDRAMIGESIIVTRDGRPVVELRPVTPPVQPGDLDWLAARRLGRPAEVDAGQLLREMRDDGDS